MRALNELARVKKPRLKAFQRAINSSRSGLLADDTIDEWKGLTDDERKLKITVFLCMARVPEKDLERIAQILNPWWAPYRTGVLVLLSLFSLMVIYQLSTYFLASRVYPKAFEYNVQFKDGSFKTHGLFYNSSMIKEDSDSGSVLLEDDMVTWLLRKSKKASYDSTLWTSNKKLFDELKFFYANFQSDAIRYDE